MIFEMDSDEDGPSLGAALAARKAGFGKDKGAIKSSRNFFAPSSRSDSGTASSSSKRLKLETGFSAGSSSSAKGGAGDESAEEDEDGSESGSDDDDDDEADDSGSAGGDSSGGGGGRLTGVKRKRGKNAPEEVSAKARVPRVRTVVAVPAIKRRDPRFDGGPVNDDMFRKAYAFLSEYKDSEIAALKEDTKKTKDPEERKRMQTLLTKLQQQRATERSADAVRKVLHDRKKAEGEAQESGKRPYYLKAREVKELARVEQFKALEAKGDAAVDKALAKRRKKLASKERRMLPRTHGGGQANGRR